MNVPRASETLSIAAILITSAGCIDGIHQGDAESSGRAQLVDSEREVAASSADPTKKETAETAPAREVTPAPPRFLHRWTAGAQYRQQVISTTHISAKRDGRSGNVTVYVQQEDDLAIESVGPDGEMRGTRHPKHLIVDVYRTEDGRVIHRDRQDTDDPRCTPAIRAMTERSFSFSVTRSFAWTASNQPELVESGIIDPGYLLAILELPAEDLPSWSTIPKMKTESGELGLQLEWHVVSEDDRLSSEVRDDVARLQFSGRGENEPEVQVEGFLEYSEPLKQVMRSRVKHTVPLVYENGDSAEGKMEFICRFEWSPSTESPPEKEVTRVDPEAVALAQRGREILQNAQVRWQWSASKLRELELTRVDRVPFEDWDAANQRDYEWMRQFDTAMEHGRSALLEAGEALQLARLAGKQGAAVELDASDLIADMNTAFTDDQETLPNDAFDGPLLGFAQLFDRTRTLELECLKSYWKLVANAIYGADDSTPGDIDNARKLVKTTSRLRKQAQAVLPDETEYHDRLMGLAEMVELGIKQATEGE